MEEPKSIEELLKELNDMQLQFDNLNEELIITKNKKRTIKTDLASDKIDTDFFKTLTVSSIKKTNNKPKVSENISEDTLLFSLDTKSESASSSTKGKTKHVESKSSKTIDKIAKTENTIIKKEKLQSKTNSKVVIENKESIIPNKKETLTKKTLVKKDSQINVQATGKDNSSENNYLSIKQKLEKIKKDISLREQELITEKGKVITLKTTKPSTNTTSKINSTALKPVKKEVTTTKPINTETPKVETVKKEILKVKPVTKIEHKKDDLNKNITKKATINQSKKKRNTIHLLTIIILVFLIVLMIVWGLLK